MPIERTNKSEGNFTVIDNTVLKDRRISLRAKGLLCLMLSLPPTWTFSQRGLSSICKDGVDSVRSALNELERAGYLSRTRVRNADGTIKGVEYTIREIPSLERPAQTSLATEQPTMESVLQSNTYASKEVLTTHQSNPAPGDAIERMDVVEQFREGIDYEILRQKHRDDPAYLQQIDEITELVTDVLTTEAPTIFVAGSNRPADVVRSRLLKLTDAHVEYVIECMRNHTQPIRNIRAYLLTALYNAPITMTNHEYAAFGSEP